MDTESDAVVDRLVVAGAFEMARASWRAASLEEIADRAGVADPGAVTYLFGSREGLLLEIITRGIHEAEERRRSLLDALSPEGSLEGLVDALIRPMAEQLVRPVSRDFVRVCGQLGEFFRPATRITDGPFSGTVLYDLRAAMFDMLSQDLGPDLAADRLRTFDVVSVHALAMRGVELQGWIDESGLSPDAAPVAAGRPDHEDFVTDLVVQCTAALTAPVPHRRARR